MPVAEEYCVKRGNILLSNSSSTLSNPTSTKKLNVFNIANNSNTNAEAGEWKLVPFFEWFFKFAELVNKNFVQLWNEGFVFFYYFI